jgi:hypothetical protein
VSNHYHQPIVTYNADSRNASSEPITPGHRAGNPSVNEFVNGRDDPKAESRWNTTDSGKILPKILYSRTEYALGARDRQFKSGHPDFFSFLCNDLPYLPSNFSVRTYLTRAQSVNC